jgi:hypothetical protein
MLPPWAVMISLSLLVFAMAWGLVLLHDAGAMGRANRYRSRYQKLIGELERLVGKANELYPLSSKVKDSVLLDHYHSCLKMIETLLEAVKKLGAHGDDEERVAAPLFLTRDIAQKIERVETALRRGAQGKPHSFMRAASTMAHQVLGCHFCSRPFDPQIFSKVRVKIDGKGSEVAACAYCRETLLLTKKARVLFFNEDGQQVHWSKAKSWTPSPEYWNINRDDINRSGRSTHLELVYSSVTRLNRPDESRDP